MSLHLRHFQNSQTEIGIGRGISSKCLHLFRTAYPKENMNTSHIQQTNPMGFDKIVIFRVQYSSWWLHQVWVFLARALAQLIYIDKLVKYSLILHLLPQNCQAQNWPFWGPLAAILDFAGGAVLQAVSECPRRR